MTWNPKGLREYLCEQQTLAPTVSLRWQIGQLIAHIDQHRPLDADGKHSSHTATCGCPSEDDLRSCPCGRGDNCGLHGRGSTFAQTVDFDDDDECPSGHHRKTGSSYTESGSAAEQYGQENPGSSKNRPTSSTPIAARNTAEVCAPQEGHVSLSAMPPAYRVGDRIGAKDFPEHQPDPEHVNSIVNGWNHSGGSDNMVEDDSLPSVHLDDRLTAAGIYLDTLRGMGLDTPEARDLINRVQIGLVANRTERDAALRSDGPRYSDDQNTVSGAPEAAEGDSAGVDVAQDGYVPGRPRAERAGRVHASVGDARLHDAVDQLKSGGADEYYQGVRAAHTTSKSPAHASLPPMGTPYLTCDDADESAALSPLERLWMRVEELKLAVLGLIGEPRPGETSPRSSATSENVAPGGSDA